MSDKEIKQRELLAEALAALSNAKDEVCDASNEANNAMCNADEASGYASNAMDQASNAEDAAVRARSELRDAVALLEELQDLLAQSSSGGQKTLDEDIVRYATKVAELVKTGAPVPVIARKLEITEFLVQACVAHNNRKAA